MSTQESHAVVSRRRIIFEGTGLLSAGAVALLAGHSAIAATQSGSHNSAQDVGTLNTALALEHEGINAYTLGAQSNLLEKPALTLAIKFQSDHKAHRDRLISVIQTLGGTPVKEKTLEEYAKELDVAKLKSQPDVLELAVGLERAAVNAYLGIIPAFSDRRWAKLAGQLASDEREHFTVLTQALGRSLPAPLSFGA
jgi:rubrerythrin